MINFDCTDAPAEAGWWADLLGGTVEPMMGDQFLTVATAGGPTLAFQHVDDPTPGKNRIHLDLETDDRAAAVASAVGAGATVVSEFEFPGLAWTVLSDPAGFQFCVAEH